jgi:hypothetical protein
MKTSVDVCAIGLLLLDKTGSGSENPVLDTGTSSLLKAFPDPPISHNTLGSVFIGESPLFILHPDSRPYQDHPNRPQNTIAWVFIFLGATFRSKRHSATAGFASQQSMGWPCQETTQWLPTSQSGSIGDPLCKDKDGCKTEARIL